MEKQNILQRGYAKRRMFILKHKDLQQLQRQQGRLALSDPCDSNFRNRELWRSTTSKGKQILAKDWQEKERGEEDANIKLCEQKKLRKSKSQPNYSREPSDSTAKTWKWLIKFSQ